MLILSQTPDKHGYTPMLPFGCKRTTEESLWSRTKDFKHKSNGVPVIGMYFSEVFRRHFTLTFSPSHCTVRSNDRGTDGNKSTGRKLGKFDFPIDRFVTKRHFRCPESVTALTSFISWVSKLFTTEGHTS